MSVVIGAAIGRGTIPSPSVEAAAHLTGDVAFGDEIALAGIGARLEERDTRSTVARVAGHAA